jgi:tetratricopeptide (TPR) repeat protein
MRLPKLVALVLLGACADDVERGDRLARERRWTEAVEAYKRAIERYPHDYDAAWGIARIYCLEVHLADKCLAWTEKLLEAYPDRADYRRAASRGWRDRAGDARRRGDEAEAKAAELKAAALEGSP